MANIFLNRNIHRGRFKNPSEILASQGKLVITRRKEEDIKTHYAYQFIKLMKNNGIKVKT